MEDAQSKHHQLQLTEQQVMHACIHAYINTFVAIYWRLETGEFNNLEHYHFG